MVTLWRTVAFAALALKLLVPIGFMPAALADGGPFALCETGNPVAHDGESSHHAGESTHHDGDASLHQDGGAQGAPASPHDEPGAHHQWERCALGALASLAAVAGPWPVVLPGAGTHEPPLPIVQNLLAQRTVTGFQSRAPPTLAS